MCETSEIINISGAGLSHLLATPHIYKEGFLYGDIEHTVCNRVSDLQYCNMQVKVSLNVRGILPAPGSHLFYTSSGSINKEILAELLSDSVGSIIGWYRYRDNSLKPTLRDRLLCEALRKYFKKYDKKYFIFCNMSCKRNICDSTHTYTYRFSKINENGRLEHLQDATGNLGESVSGYKRIKKCEADDPFNEAIANCARNGNPNVSEVAHDLLKNAADEFVDRESEMREIEAEIQQMTTLLADHYRAKISSVRTAARIADTLDEENSFIKPIVESAVAVEKQEPSEPFGFITDIIKSNLKPASEEELLKSPSGSENSPSKVHLHNIITDNKQLEINSQIYD